MGEITDFAAEVYRDSAVAGVPASGGNEPYKPDIRRLFTLLETTIASTGSAIQRYASVAASNVAVQPAGTLAYVYKNNGTTTDPANGFYQSDGSTFVPAPWFFSGANSAALAALEPVDDSATAGLLASALLSGVENIAVPINGNSSDLRTDAANALSGQPFKTLLLTDAVAATSYLTSGPTKLRIANGGGVTIPPEQLPGGTIAEFQYSAGGQIFVLNSTEPFGKSTDVVSADDPDYKTKPYGTVTFSGGTRSIAPIDKYITIPGSSNAAYDYVAAGSRPAELAVLELNDAFPGTGINFIADNQAVQGAPWTAINGQLDQSVAFAIGNTRWVIPFFWMNDCRSIFYHDFGGVLAQIAMIEPTRDRARKKNAELILVTGFGPDPRVPGDALDPQYFAQNPGQSMAFPAAKAAPVNPETQMTPPASQALVQRDWSGNGVTRSGYTRLWHFNRMIRREAARLGCVLWDVEKSAYRNCIETVPDLGSGLDTFYDSGNPLHPKAPMYQQGVRPVIRQWAQDMAAGRTDRRVYTGF